MKTKNISCIPVFIQCGTGVESNLSFQDDGELFYSKKLTKPDGINSNVYVCLISKGKINVGDRVLLFDNKTIFRVTDKKGYLNGSDLCDLEFAEKYCSKIEATTDPELNFRKVRMGMLKGKMTSIPAISNLPEFVKWYNDELKWNKTTKALKNYDRKTGWDAFGFGDQTDTNKIDYLSEWIKIYLSAESKLGASDDVIKALLSVKYKIDSLLEEKMPQVFIEMENTSWGFQQMSNKGIGSTIIPDVFKVKTNSKNQVKIIFK